MISLVLLLVETKKTLQIFGSIRNFKKEEEFQAYVH